jgi:hypothetical protein
VRLCGAYLGDNDGTCPQLTCIRDAGHAPPHDNVEGDRPAGPVLLVGESNPYGSDPEFALYPTPRNCAGDRLRRLVLGVSVDEYMGAGFARANLCAGSWSARRAAESAAVLADRHDRFVLLGARVSAAFGVPFRPFSVVRRGGAVLAVLPHPSGRCRLWNAPGAFELARALLRSEGLLA